ncbi:MAG: pseudouridine synthase [Myxococcota bacterium]
MADPVRIVLRRERLVVVDKPAGVVAHATRGAIGRPLLQRVRNMVGKQVFLLHRLDAATSGLVALALDAEMAGLLGPTFGTARVEKRYLGFVRGVPREEEGVIDHPIPRSEDGPRVPALTGWRKLWTSGRYSLLAVRPRSGRRHQIRRHLKHLSWPLIGDVRYGKGEHNRKFREEVGLHRLALHACFLKLTLPDGEALAATSPLPRDLRRPLAHFGVPAGVLDAAPATPVALP